MATLSRAMDDVYSNGSLEAWTPALDAWETEHAFVVQFDLPGITSDQVELTFDRNTLTVHGKRAATLPATDRDEVRVFLNERTAGEFTRSLRFPQYVESAKIEAAFANGVLTVTVPKAEAAKARKIQISN
jgi:HSP20 family protein